MMMMIMIMIMKMIRIRIIIIFICMAQIQLYNFQMCRFLIALYNIIYAERVLAALPALYISFARENRS